MAMDRNIRAVAAEIAAQDAKLLEDFGNRAKWGQGDYAVAYSVLRAVQMVGRFVVAAGLDDEERAKSQEAQAGVAEAPRPEPEAAMPEPAVIEAHAPTKGKGRVRPANGR